MPKEVLYEFLKVLIRRGYGWVTRHILSVGEATLRSLSRLAFSNHFCLPGLLCSVKIDKFKCPCIYQKMPSHADEIKKNAFMFWFHLSHLLTTCMWQCIWSHIFFKRYDLSNSRTFENSKYAFNSCASLIHILIFEKRQSQYLDFKEVFIFSLHINSVTKLDEPHDNHSTSYVLILEALQLICFSRG